MMLPDQHFLIT